MRKIPDNSFERFSVNQRRARRRREIKAYVILGAIVSGLIWFGWVLHAIFN